MHKTKEDTIMGRPRIILVVACTALWAARCFAADPDPRQGRPVQAAGNSEVTFKAIQDGKQRIIYSKDKDVVFRVEGAPPNSTYTWDLKGDGNTTAAYNGPNNGGTTPSITVKYTDDGEGAGRIVVLEDAQHRRWDFNKAKAKVTVTPPGSAPFTRELTIRVMLKTVQGTNFPGELGNPPGKEIAPTNTYLTNTFHWDNTHPVGWSTLSEGLDATERQLFGLALVIQDGNRLQVSPNLVPPEAALTKYICTISDTWIVCSVVSNNATCSAFYARQEELTSFVKHEEAHATQWAHVISDTDVWHELREVSSSPSDLLFQGAREAQAYNWAIFKAEASHRHIAGQLGSLVTYWNQTVAGYDRLDAGSLKNLVRQHLQSEYDAIVGGWKDLGDPTYDYNLGDRPE